MTTIIELSVPGGQLEALHSARTHSLRASRLAVAWESLVTFVAPIGYQDDAGFHYGEPAAPVRVELICE